MNSDPILIVAGEPYSVFSEIFFKSIKRYESKKPVILIGSIELFNKQMKSLGYNFLFNEISKDFKNSDLYNGKIINIINIDLNLKRTFDKITEKSNEYIHESFDVALKILKKKKSLNLINGPISKKDFLKKKYPGVTEYLQFKTKTKDVAMLIYNKNFSVSPITTHIPVKDIYKKIKGSKILNNVKLISNFYNRYLKFRPKIGITGLNPHCESNFTNSEEKNIIIPAIKKIKEKFKNIEGPLSTDSLFMKENLKNFNVVIGMYHDQVLTPAKALNGFNAINITLGLPFIRISPDHGTNNKMIGKNKSDPTSLIEAIKFLDHKCR